MGCGVNAAVIDSGPPTIWIELGGQLERVEKNGEEFSPAFVARNPNSPAFQPMSMSGAQRAPRYSAGLEGKITFEPAASSWLFTAAVRYGRSNGSRFLHQQTAGISPPTTALVHGYSTFSPLPVKNFAESKTRNNASQTVLDFQAGKDVGLGILGEQSNINLGVRFAQFSSTTDVELHARPEIKFGITHIPVPPYVGFPGAKYWHTYAAQAHVERSFHGVGPSLAWNDTVTVAGNKDQGVSFDWGLNAAILFGRQTVHAEHRTTSYRFYALRYPQYVEMYAHHPAASMRSKNVIVPNFGGFAGLSFNYSNAKVKLGYRADFFLGATDGGIDIRKTYDRNFYGPFATISIGLGG